MAETDGQTEKAQRKPRQPTKKRGGWATVFSLLVSCLILTFVVLAMSERTVPLPRFLSAKIEERMSERLGSVPVEVGPMRLAIARNGVPQVLMRDLRLRSDTGGAVAELNTLLAELSVEQLITGKFSPSAVALAGAQITIRRTSDGAFQLDTGDAASAEDAALTDILANVDQAMSDGALSSLSEVVANGVVITLEDAKSGRIWQATNASAVLRTSAEALTVSVTSDVFNGTDDLAGVQLSLTRNRATGHVLAGFSVADMPAADIALQSPVLSWLGVLDAPISGAVRTEIDETGQLVSFAGTLDMEGGALRPDDTVEPIPFDAAKAYFTFDPDRQRIAFSQISVQSETANLQATGHTYLAELEGPWPRAYLGQFVVESLDYAGGNLFEAPVSLADIRADMRLRLNPFSIEVPQAALAIEDRPIQLSGWARIGETGWLGAVDATTESMSSQQLLSYWPIPVSPITRGWLSKNLKDGNLLGPVIAARFVAGQQPDISLSLEFEDGVARFMSDMPQLTDARGRLALSDHRFSLLLENGGVTPGEGGRVDTTGTTVTIEDVRPKPAWGVIDVAAQGPLTGALSILNNPPLRIMERAERPIDLASAQATARARIGLPLKDGIRTEEVSYEVAADFTEVSSDTLVEGRRLTSENLKLTATADMIAIDGRARLDGVPFSAAWRQPLDDRAGEGGVVTGEVALSQASVAAFDIPLPTGAVQGESTAQYRLTLPSDASPSRLELSSDLKGLAMSLDGLGWRKSRGEAGDLTVTATLGDVPRVEKFALETSGLGVEGRLDLTSSGGLASARLNKVRLGDWLDTNVTLSPKGITVQGGRLDLRRMELGGDGGGSTSGPVDVRLDRLVVSDGISLAPLTGRIEQTRFGLSGEFQARVNGRTPVRGTLSPARGGTAIRLQSDSAAGVLRDTGLTPNAREGSLDLVLTPVVGAPSGTFDGEFLIKELRLRDAPAMADLLDAISVVGLIDQLNGPGIRFETIDGRFRLNRNQIRLQKAAAVGSSIGISADGVYDLRSDQMDFRGVISPVYFLNGIGSIFSRRGEGLFGFNYRMAGAADNPRVGVNPLSILTPGRFREIFRSGPPVN